MYEYHKKVLRSFETDYKPLNSKFFKIYQYNINELKWDIPGITHRSTDEFSEC
jgi:hypothetical protein